MKDYLRIPADKIVQFASSQENYDRVGKWSCIGMAVYTSACFLSIIVYRLIH
jgi:hypothetical protein